MRRFTLFLTALVPLLSACGGSGAASSDTSSAARSSSGGSTSHASAAKVWHGKLDRYTSRVSFSVDGSRIVNFTIPEAPAYCLTGFSAVTVDVPSASLRAGDISGSVHVTYNNETEYIDLDGHVDGQSATGRVRMHGPCDGTFTWTAQPA